MKFELRFREQCMRVSVLIWKNAAAAATAARDQGDADVTAVPVERFLGGPPDDGRGRLPFGQRIIDDAFDRASFGIESIQDILADLELGFAAAKGA